MHFVTGTSPCIMRPSCSVLRVIFLPSGVAELLLDNNWSLLCAKQ